VALNAFGLTDVGRKRKHNEDAYLLDAERGLFVVADGMGGHAAGEVASRLTVESIQEFISGTEDDHDNTWPFGYNNRYSVDGNRLSTAVERANEKVMRAVVNRPELKGMGTTVVAALFDERRATLVHVGDSRAYLLRESELRRLTDDHSWVQEQVNAGILSEEEARSHPLKNVVTRALGGGMHVAVDLIEIPVGGDDRFLLCSDGLTGMVSDEEITAALSSSRSLEEIVRGLIELANERGGVDNITAIVVEVKAARPAESPKKTTDISREKTAVSLRVPTVSDEDVTPKDGVEMPVGGISADVTAPRAPEAPPEAPEAPETPESLDVPEASEAPPEALEPKG
jgi:protein phosphatase